MQYLKQSTAVTLKFGPFVDETDGKTAETALTLSQADFRLSKNGGDFAQKNEATSGTHDEIGYYDVPLNTTDTNTLGSLLVAVHESGALPVWKEYTVLAANVYDSLIGGGDLLSVDIGEISGDATAADNLEAAADGTGYNLGGGSITVDVVKISGDSTAADNAESFFDGTGYAGTNNVIPTVSSVATGGITSSSFAAGAINAAAIAADAITDAKVASDVTIASVTGAVGSVAGDVGGKILGTGAGGGTMSGAGVWAYDHTGAAITSGSGLDAAGVRAAVGLASANLDTQLSTIDDFLDTEIAAIKAKTDNLPSDPADASDISGAFSTVNSTLATIAGYIDTEVAAIKAKTDLIPAAPAEIGSAMTLADGAITTAKFASGAIDAAAIATDAFGALELAAGAASEIAAAVVDQTLSGHTTAGTVGGALNSAGSGSLGSAGADPLTTPAATATYGAKLDFIHAVLANEQTQTKTLQTVAKADGTVISEAPVTSDGTTVTREKFANP